MLGCSRGWSEGTFPAPSDRLRCKFSLRRRKNCPRMSRAQVAEGEGLTSVVELAPPRAPQKVPWQELEPDDFRQFL